MSGVSIEQLVLADEPERWAALGFAVEGDAVQLGAVRLRLAGEDAGRGIVGWSLRGIASTELDGMATTRADGTEADGLPAEHSNGVVAIDHVVAMTPVLERTVQALRDAGLDLRRIREQPTPAGAPRQAFFRLGAEILEVVQEPEHVIATRGDGGIERSARLWGLAFLAPDLDRTVAALGEHAGEARDAVQPGRRIATVRRSAGLAVPVALMSARS
jgi:catechol 2,3-dioxygenase-like lactoylglutathione lyase family enzyme